MNIVDIAIKELEEAIEARKNALAKGHIKDFAEYQHVVGVITGLASAKERLKDLLKYEEEM
jgi:hypothetical protein